MTRKLTRDYSLIVAVAASVAILVLLIAAAVRAQVAGADRPSGKANAVLTPAGASAPAQAERPLTPWTDGAGRFPMSRSRTKPLGAGPMDENPLFLPAMNYSGGIYPYSVAVADVNGDGKPDLVVDGTVEVMLGNGDGTFQHAVHPSAGTGALAVAIADLNGDGKPDLVVGNDTNVAVLLGNGDGTFRPAVTYNSGTETPLNVVIADLKGDGKLDVVVPGINSGVVGVLLGNGDGTFQPVVTYDPGGWGPSTVAVADVNLDGKLDIVVANACASECAYDGNVGVLLGNGDGTFQPAVTYGSGGTQPMSVAVADLNGDGKPDVVVTNYTSANVGILLGNGDGTFQPAVTYDSGGDQPLKVAVSDLNGDGKPDVVVANVSSGIGVLLGNGDGTFQPVVTYDPGGVLPSSVAIADVNGDGAPDLLVTNWEGFPHGDGVVSVLLNASGPRNATATALVPSANPVVPNQTVTYTATVTSQSGGTVDGTVIFQDYISGEPWTVVRTTAILVGNQAAYSATYKAGSHVITAMYGGNTDSAGSISAALREQTERLPFKTATVVSTSGSPSFVGRAVTFTATVACGTHAIPDGELVTFYDSTAMLGSVALSGGTAAYTTSSLSVKTHTIKATYAGDATFEPSAGSVTQVVDKYPTTTTLSSSLNPSNYGQAVTLTATVTSAGPTPTGTVYFKNGSATLGIGTLNAGGVATLTTAKIPVGANTLTATYNGDTSNGKSVSAAITQTVSQASVSMVLTSTPNPSTFGQSVKFTATLTSNGGVPSGQPVTFSYNSATLGTANVNSKGVATFSTKTLPRGSDAVTAAYAGSVDYTSASATVTQVVN